MRGSSLVLTDVIISADAESASVVACEQKIDLKFMVLVYMTFEIYR